MQQPKVFILLAVALTTTACATIDPTMDYRSDVVYHPAEVSVDVEVQASPRVLSDGLIDPSALDSFETALKEDLAANGPLQVTSIHPDAVLRVTVVAHAVSPPTGIGHLAWFFYLWPLLGGALERTDLDMTLEAALVDPAGRTLYTTTVRARTLEYTGLYDQRVTYEGLAQELGERLRKRLSTNRQEVIAALYGEQVAAERGRGPTRAISGEPEPPSELDMGGWLVSLGVGWPGTMTLGLGLGLSEHTRMLLEAGGVAFHSAYVVSAGGQFQQAMFCGVGVCTYASLGGVYLHAEVLALDNVGATPNSDGTIPPAEGRVYQGWGVGPLLGVEYAPFDHGLRFALEGGALFGDWERFDLLSPYVTPSLTLRTGYSW